MVFAMMYKSMLFDMKAKNMTGGWTYIVRKMSMVGMNRMVG